MRAKLVMAVAAPAVDKVVSKALVGRYQERDVPTKRSVYTHVTALTEAGYSISRP